MAWNEYNSKHFKAYDDEFILEEYKKLNWEHILNRLQLCAFILAKHNSKAIS
jgi:hypothetical protein